MLGRGVMCAGKRSVHGLLLSRIRFCAGLPGMLASHSALVSCAERLPAGRSLTSAVAVALAGRRHPGRPLCLCAGLLEDGDEYETVRVAEVQHRLLAGPGDETVVSHPLEIRPNAYYTLDETAAILRVPRRSILRLLEAGVARVEAPRAGCVAADDGPVAFARLGVLRHLRRVAQGRGREDGRAVRGGQVHEFARGGK